MFVFLKKNWIAILLALLVVGGITAITILNIHDGWNGEKTISYSFFAVIVVGGFSVFQPLKDYYLTNNKNMIKSNNKLFNKLEELEKAGLLDKYFEYSHIKSKNDKLIKINEYLSNYYDKTQLNHPTLVTFINEKHYLNEPFRLDVDGVAQLLFMYKEYDDYISKDDEKLYADYKSKKILERESFPIFTTLFPLILSIFGIFSTLYEYVRQGVFLYTSLLTYLVAFIISIFDAVLYCISAIPSLVKAEIDKNNIRIEEIDGFVNNNDNSLIE